MSHLIARLESVASVAAPGDWNDVVGRAERLNRRTVRKRLVIAIAVALLVVPAIAIATQHWNLFSLTATHEEVPLPEGEAKLGYVVGTELHLPGRPAAKLTHEVGAYLPWANPLVVQSPDGRNLVYHTWVREVDKRRGMLKSATNFLRVYDLETGRDELLERGAAGVAWRRDGMLAYTRATVPEFRNTRRGWKGARFGHIYVRRSVEARPVRWTTTEAAWVPLAWAGDMLLAESSGVWAFTGPGSGRPLNLRMLLAISPDGKLVLGLGPATAVTPLLRVVEPATGRVVFSATGEDVPGAEKDGIDRNLVVPLGQGSWTGDTIIAPSGMGHALPGVVDFTRPETLKTEAIAGLTVLRFSDGKLSVERTLKLSGAVAEATGVPYRYSSFEFVHPLFVDSSARQFTSDVRVIPASGRPHFFFVTCDIVDERCRRGRLRRPWSTLATLVYNPSRPLHD
jgi:hypothetical protein